MTPTEGSANPVQSGGVFTALANLIADGGLFGGFVSPSSVPNTKYFYLTDVEGVYTHFDNVNVNDDSLTLFYYKNNSWQNAIIAPSYQFASKVLLSEDLYIALGFSLFDPSLDYAQGDIVVHNGYLYVFTEDHPHGQWDESDVEYDDINKELKDLYVDLAELIDGKQDTISDLAAIRSGAAAGATAYQKPSGGIPKTDLASGVQTSLGKADTAFQKPSGGIPASDLAAAVQTSLGKADTALQSYTETDPVFSASPAAGITSGDISDWDGKAENIPVVDASTIPASMDADKVYQYGTLAGDTTFPALNTPSDLTVAHVYCWTFATPSTAPTITWPVAITSWAGGSAPTINASKNYEVSVMDGLATIIEA